MTLNASGQLGIGTTIPNRKLTIQGTSNAYMSFNATSNRNTTIGSDGVGNFVVFDDTFGDYRMAIFSDGNFAINRSTNGGYKLDVNGTARVSGATSINGTAISGTVLTLQESASLSGALGMSNRNSTQTYRFAVDSAAVDDKDFCIINSDAATIPFKIATTGAATFSSSVSVGTGLSLSGATAPASGIQFPATQVASASANNLDDYEEGTFTMGIAFGGASVGVTYLANTGTYTKIGRQVTVNGFVYLSSKGSSTGTARVTGLPFTIGNSGANLSAPSLNVYAITFGNQIQGLGDTNQTTIVLEQVSALGTVATITDADFSNSSYIVLSFTYFV
jgi:hypothetical protein